jgi:ABC-type lipoprotein release transport system permease subunit
MSAFRLIFKEITHRKLNFLLALLAIGAAVTLFVSVLTMGRASEREAVRLMRDMGFNLRILPRDTNMENFWASDFAEHEMPEEYVNRLVAEPGLAVNHLVATLQKKVDWSGRQILLTGILPEVQPPGKPTSPMGFTIDKGTVYVGFELARSAGLKKGDVIDVFGKEFTVAQSLAESGTKDDIRIYGHLHDVQQVLGKKGKINEIKALHCMCDGGALATLREKLAQAFPDTQVVEFRSIALARAETRRMVEKYAAFIMPAVMVVCAAWIGVLTMMNVRERRREIGILRALGFGSGKIGSLFLGKALFVGLVAAAVGFGVGTGLALQFGPTIFKVTAQAIKPLYGLLWWSLAVAPLFAALASFLPTVVAVTQDPAITLIEE